MFQSCIPSLLAHWGMGIQASRVSQKIFLCLGSELAVLDPPLQDGRFQYPYTTVRKEAWEWVACVI